MRVLVEKLLLSLFLVAFYQGCMVLSVEYDHTASIECLGNPMKPLYKGGVVQNSEFNSGLMGWSTYRNIKAGVSSSPSGNKFAVVHGAGSHVTSSGKLLPSHSVYQRLQMQGDRHYSLSAWLQVSNGTSAHVRAVIKSPNGERVIAGAIDAQSGCWSMLKGGMTAYSSGPAEIYFESYAPVDIWVDSVSLQPFTFDEWDAHTRRSADKARRRTVKVVAMGADDKPMAHANVSIELLRLGFPFGNAVTKEILDESL